MCMKVRLIFILGILESNHEVLRDSVVDWNEFMKCYESKWVGCMAILHLILW